MLATRPGQRRNCSILVHWVDVPKFNAYHSLRRQLSLLTQDIVDLLKLSLERNSTNLLCTTCSAHGIRSYAHQMLFCKFVVVIDKGRKFMTLGQNQCQLAAWRKGSCCLLIKPVNSRRVLEILELTSGHGVSNSNLPSLRVKSNFLCISATRIRVGRVSTRTRNP